MSQATCTFSESILEWELLSLNKWQSEFDAVVRLRRREKRYLDAFVELTKMSCPDCMENPCLRNIPETLEQPRLDGKAIRYAEDVLEYKKTMMLFEVAWCQYGLGQWQDCMKSVLTVSSRLPLKFIEKQRQRDRHVDFASVACLSMAVVYHMWVRAMEGEEKAFLNQSARRTYPRLRSAQDVKRGDYTRLEETVALMERSPTDEKSNQEDKTGFVAWMSRHVSPDDFGLWYMEKERVAKKQERLQKKREQRRCKRQQQVTQFYVGNVDMTAVTVDKSREESKRCERQAAIEIRRKMEESHRQPTVTVDVSHKRQVAASETKLQHRAAHHHHHPHRRRGRGVNRQREMHATVTASSIDATRAAMPSPPLVSRSCSSSAVVNVSEHPSFSPPAPPLIPYEKLKSVRPVPIPILFPGQVADSSPPTAGRKKRRALKTLRRQHIAEFNQMAQ